MPSSSAAVRSLVLAVSVAGSGRARPRLSRRGRMSRRSIPIPASGCRAAAASYGPQAAYPSSIGGAGGRTHLQSLATRRGGTHCRRRRLQPRSAARRGSDSAGRAARRRRPTSTSRRGCRRRPAGSKAASWRSPSAAMSAPARPSHSDPPPPVARGGASPGSGSRCHRGAHAITPPPAAPLSRADAGRTPPSCVTPPVAQRRRRRPRRLPRPQASRAERSPATPATTVAPAAKGATVASIPFSPAADLSDVAKSELDAAMRQRHASDSQRPRPGRAQLSDRSRRQVAHRGRRICRGRRRARRHPGAQHVSARPVSGRAVRARL